MVQLMIDLAQEWLNLTAPWHHFAATSIDFFGRGFFRCQRQFGGRVGHLHWQWICRPS
jgi:hypothetical protein